MNKVSIFFTITQKNTCIRQTLHSHKKAPGLEEVKPGLYDALQPPLPLVTDDTIFVFLLIYPVRCIFTAFLENLLYLTTLQTIPQCPYCPVYR